MDLTLLLLQTCIGLVFIVLYFAFRHRTYWKRRGILHDEPHILFGNMIRDSRGDYMAIYDAYYKFRDTGPFCGFYYLLKPALLVLDLELIKKILITDFNNFDERGVFHNEKKDPLSESLLTINGNRWRPLRKKLTSTFTSGKIKFMFPIVAEVGNRFADTLGKTLEVNPIVEVTNILARFTADVIGTCAFGIDCKSLENTDAQFLEMGKKVFKSRRYPALVNIFMRSYPNLARKFGLKTMPEDVENFFIRFVNETVEYREKHGIMRDDFMGLLINLKNQEADSLTMSELVAQVFLFFVAGFESSSTAMSFTLYELAKHQDIQHRLRRELKDILQKHNGEFTYDCMKEMKYMDQVINEILRMYPAAPHLFRQAKENYCLDNPKYYIEKGSLVIIPSMAIQYDPNFYPEPMKFDPERFNSEEIQKRDNMTWLPFGDGPRNCIGLRFAKMQICIGLCLLITRFRVDICAKTEIPLKYDFRFVLKPKNGVHLMVERV